MTLIQEHTLTTADLRHIVERVSTITERLSPAFRSDERSADDSHIAVRLAAWSQTVAKDDERLFQRRLAWDGLDTERVRSVLYHVRLGDNQPLPA